MELSDFISSTLVGIVNGVKDANKRLATNEDSRGLFAIESASHHKNRDDGYIQFDIAVTASSETNKNGGIGIKVLETGIGGEIKNRSIDQTISRIKFGVAPNITTG